MLFPRPQLEVQPIGSAEHEYAAFRTVLSGGAEESNLDRAWRRFITACEMEMKPGNGVRACLSFPAR